MKITSIILAAGQGTRMKSELPKVLHPVCGKPMVWHALQAAQSATSEKPVMVIGHGAEQVRDSVGDSARFVVQEERLGTGHAVQEAESTLKGEAAFVLVSSADMPLLTEDTLSKLVSTQKANTGPMTMLTIIADDQRGFGRIMRGEDGGVRAILEEADCTEEQKAIKEVNVGAYCFSADWLWDALSRIPLSAKGEYYLTDTVALAVDAGMRVEAITLDDAVEAIGVNSRIHLSEAEAGMRSRVNRAHMLKGITMIDPASTYIGMDVEIGQDSVIHPNTFLRGETKIGAGCEIGPNSIITDCTIGDRCEILSSVLEKAILEDDVDMGPFARLRKGAYLSKGVHMGNFGEVKDSRLGEGVKMGHFSYVGNATIGAETNIGAGTITCNYDGKNKYHTEIGEKVFIGSDTMLVAPLNIGDRASTGAGAVVTKDVKEDTLAVGMPARSIRKLNQR
ncbi:MAG: bifunctional UDP-N-acetylglucosamine diphosphorylase/glucosamine-1-phosphate N-acetyltransferase GlmU [Anaerolineae bacterium]|jgi:bifunctional UDP-N-acetylglucosamine pyrophosphorylase/glucosamine-1-phosphate N-acetyltransferase|nr:bifunctional UDP-N-acetylglucosamine diphosphorylase/glucosamine-1-phosphate N-acetyltransferase GlmU [Anaerolineae bacterium]MBT4312533.1 bifunctional UDP-N-acetylglucosamine diphosphorylase/glucosamine-1-phosphate N-acetyltransferase GlmU [Anaerolineae bacterium]MBT4457656.1 bifunctional UDP-N-acetylglucosamine diphosphorylase/glucosamine-1-phosphate N-acetyltransferase GlmU [Anaerolineae bacterium]MBT4841151.1 bifunctional UDP-N-acetylglucosamine diphosphorylase/glucosamine-1-phosphate N-a